MFPKYPEASVQHFFAPWWRETAESVPRRGRLVWAILPHVDQHPYTLEAAGDVSPVAHDVGTFRIVPLRAGSIPGRSKQPPSLALPLFPGEVHALYSAKFRPALVISVGGRDVPGRLRKRFPKYQTNPTMLVAPYYGADLHRASAGWNPQLVERIRRCEYSQYLWDVLPLKGRSESILRLDQIRPLGRHGESFRLTPFRLSSDALILVDEWIEWIITGRLPQPGLLGELRTELLGLASS